MKSDKLSPLDRDDTITIVSATDSAYVPGLAGLISSVLSNAKTRRRIDFVVLDGGIDPKDRGRLRHLRHLHPNCGVYFVDMAERFSSAQVHAHFTIATYYRLALPSVLPNKNRVLYIDPDTIVLDDVATIFDINLAGSLAAATLDFVVRAFVNLGTQMPSQIGNGTALHYLTEHLRLSRSGTDYFQAGVMLLDLHAMRLQGFEEEVAQDARERLYWFVDQDVLNVHLEARIHFLPARWDLIVLDEEHFAALNPLDQDVYRRAFEDPAVIHYAGRSKPWINNNNALSAYYWQYLRSTLWYEDFLEKRLNWNYDSERV